MNSVNLIGRLTKDPVIRYSQDQTAFASFSIAIDRGKDKTGKDLGADYPSIKCVGKTAELVEKYLAKGRQVGITGKIQTGSYEKEGRKVYTTEVFAERIEFLGRQEQGSGGSATQESQIPEGFSQLTDDDIPF